MADQLRLKWTDGKQTAFHWIWLRDNCRCPDCGEATIGRRTLRLSDLPLDVAVSDAEILPNNRLVVNWADGHRSTFAGDWLREYAYDDEARRSRAFRPPLWDEAIRSRPPRLSFAAVMQNPSAFLTMLHKLRDYGLCFLQDVPIESGILQTLARRIGPIQESNFGRVQDLVFDPSKRSVANATIALKTHTDEPYRASPPGLLMFHCLESDATGAGASIFLDGFEIAEILRSEDQEGFAALARYGHAFRRHFDDDVDLIAEFPVLSLDPFGNLTGIRLNDRVAAPLTISSDAVPIYYRGLQRLLALSEDKRRMITLTLKPGDAAIFDNHRILHGRKALSATGRRWLQWMQVERGDFHSCLRITADRLQQSRDAAPLLRGAYG